MIYTSYFGNLKNLPNNVIPISICGKAPDWYTGLQYKKLAPKQWFFKRWKENHNNNFYIKCFNEEVLQHLNARDVINDLITLIHNSSNDIVLICYEKPSEFCHRHLVRKWLKYNGIKCKEWS